MVRGLACDSPPYRRFAADYACGVSIDRSAVRLQMRFVNEKLNDWDFIGVGDSVSDEYDCMVGPLTRMLRDGDNAGEIAEYINSEVRDHFGMGDAVPRQEVTAVVADLIQTWRNRLESGFGQAQ